MAAVLSRALSWSSSCICCNSRNFSLWRSEKAWEGSRNMNYWGTPVFTQKISARQLFCTTCSLCALVCILPNHTPANSPSFLYMSWDCLCISYSVQSSSPQCLPQRFSYLCILRSAAAALFALLWWLCTSYSIPPYIPDSGLTLFSLFLLLISCLRLCCFSRNKGEGGIFISFFPSSGIWSAVLIISSPLQNTKAVDWWEVYLTTRHCRI